VLELSKEVELFLTVAKYFNVPPLELLDYPIAMFDAMVLYLDREVKENQLKNVRAKAHAQLKEQTGGTMRHHNRNLRRR